MLYQCIKIAAVRKSDALSMQKFQEIMMTTKTLNQLVLLVAMFGVGSQASNAASVDLFTDNFDRSTSNNIGNAWRSYENDDDDVAIIDDPYSRTRDDNVLRLRDRQGSGSVDAGVKLSFDSSAYDSLTIAFDWSPLEDSDNKDKLILQYSSNDKDWFKLFELALESDEDDEHEHEHDEGDWMYQSASYAKTDNKYKDMFGTGLYLRLITDVSSKKEGALIDNFSLLGLTEPSQEGGSLPAAAVPEPGTLALLGLGLFAAFGRKGRVV